MPITSRPDLLPFAKTDTIGCPYHGRVVANQLTLPNSQTITYPSPADGRTQLIRHPLAATPTRTPTELAADTVAGYQWKNYAVLAGSGSQVCGQELSGSVIAPNALWLYCDAAYSWIISLKWDKPDTLTQRLAVTLEKLFGVLADDAPTMTPRTLVSYTWTPKQGDGDNQSASDASLERHLDVTHSASGAVTVVNVGAYGGLATSIWPAALIDYPPTGTAQRNVGYHDALQITISGNGSLVAGHVGEGISATVTHIAEAPDLYQTTGAGQGDYLCSPPALPQSNEYGYTRTFWYTAEQDGTVTHIEHVVLTTDAISYVNANCAGPTYDRIDTTSVTVSEWSWSGHTISSTRTVVSYYDTSYHEVSATGDGVPNYWRVHPNMVATTIGGSSAIRVLGSASLDVTGYADAPNWVNTTWEPDADTITYVDGGDAGCYV